MFHEQRSSVPNSVDTLRREYATDLSEAVETTGVTTAVEQTGIGRDRIEAVAAGDLSGLSLEEAGAIQSLVTDLDGETVVEMACDHLLLGMSTAVLDVDRLAVGVDLDLDPKEIQQKLERRAPMTFEEYLRLQYRVVSEQ